MNYNRVLLMGRLTRDPEIRYTPQSVAVTDIGIAVNREYTVQGGAEGPGQTGERRQEVTFVDVTVWRRRAEVICQYLKKGDPIFIEGRLTQDTWQTQDGQKRTKLKIVADDFRFIGSSRGQGGGGGAGGGGSTARAAGPGGGEQTEYEYPGQPASGSWDEGAGGEPLVDESEVPF